MRFRATGDEGQAWCGKPRGSPAQSHLGVPSEGGGDWAAGGRRGSGGRDWLRRLCWRRGGGRQGAPRGSPRCLGGSTETLAMARPSEGSGSREPARFYLFLGRSQFALSGFFRHPGTGRGKGGPHQHDPVNLCGIASGSLRAAVPLSPERAAPGRYYEASVCRSGLSSLTPLDSGKDTGRRRTAKAAASPEREGGVTKKH